MKKIFIRVIFCTIIMASSLHVSAFDAYISKSGWADEKEAIITKENYFKHISIIISQCIINRIGPDNSTQFDDSVSCVETNTNSFDQELGLLMMFSMYKDISWATGKGEIKFTKYVENIILVINIFH